MTFLSKMPGESSILMKIPEKCPGTGQKLPGSKNGTWQKVLRIQFYIRVPFFSLIRANGCVDTGTARPPRSPTTGTDVQNQAVDPV